MYENARVDKMCDTFAHWMRDWKARCEGCEHFVYPPFTAEKQFFILKFIADNKICGERPIIQFHWDDIGEQYYFYLQIPPDCYHAHDKDYDIALAKVVNLVWTKLTPEQQQQIKEILE